MGAPAEHPDEIVANAQVGSGSSTGSLAAYIANSCGHVWLDQRIAAQGYRFYPALNEEIPHFFNKRLVQGVDSLAVTLQAGMTFDADDPFEACESNAEAQQILDRDDFRPSLWLTMLTMGAEMLRVRDISDPLFIAKNPAAFRTLAEELVAAGVISAHTCPICSDQE